ncbi:DUF397 domain-containing protein [Salinactinospora qingdaonensis]|uniref:DUF397 domain-containing protein n=1 Tax=Salinactinospora qingdaonensis TaxID=702744 RepID=A0ABP7F8J3_9ACTN
MEAPEFRKSSYSNRNQNCVEVADLPAGAAVRDSQNREQGHLSFAIEEWRAFVDAVKGGRL